MQTRHGQSDRRRAAGAGLTLAAATVLMGRWLEGDVSVGANTQHQPLRGVGHCKHQ
jgi:hypothetical protein